jgi:hypothetical protein
MTSLNSPENRDGATDMNTHDIVRALSNVGATWQDGIDGRVVVLNAYRW